MKFPVVFPPGLIPKQTSVSSQVYSKQQNAVIKPIALIHTDGTHSSWWNFRPVPRMPPIGFTVFSDKA